MIGTNGIQIDLVGKVITHNGNVYVCVARGGSTGRSGVTPDKQFETLKMLIMSPRGISRGQLFDHLYGDDEDGGPDVGPNIFSVRFTQWAKQFADLELELYKETRNGVMFYKLLPKPKFSVQKTADRICAAARAHVV